MTKGAKEILYIELEDIAAIVAVLRNSQREYGEDIPPFERADIHKLNSCLEQARLRVFGRPVHRTLVDKAIWYFYGLIKNHPLVNGNKRLAVYTCLEFLRRNGKRFILYEEALERLFEMAIETALSAPEARPQVEAQLRASLRRMLAE